MAEQEDAPTLDALVAQGKTVAAIQQLQELLTDKLPKRYGNELTILQNQVSTLRDEEISNLTTTDERTRTANRINRSFLELLNDLRRDLSSQLQFYNTLPAQVTPKQTNLADYLRTRTAGRYEIVDKPLAEGSNVIIYKAKEAFSQRDVVIKLLRGERIDREVLLPEVERIARMKHRGITKILDIYFEEYPYFVVTEFVHGMDLESMMLRSGYFSFYMVLDILTELCTTLDYARRYDLHHFTIRPSKVILDEEGYPMVSPFGMLRTGQQRERSLEKIIEDCRYFSPEMLLTDMKVRTAREATQADQFALGLLAYEMLTGRKLFVAKTLPELILERELFLKNSKLDDYIPRHLRKTEMKPFWNVLERMLQRNPNKRFADLSQAAKALAVLRPARTALHELTLASYNRALANAWQKDCDLIRIFYDRLFKVLPEARSMFSQNMERQYNMFRTAVRMFLEFNAHGSFMDNLVNMPVHKGVHWTDYTHFVDEFLRVVQEYDPCFNDYDDLDGAWDKLRDQFLERLSSRLAIPPATPTKDKG